MIFPPILQTPVKSSTPTDVNALLDSILGPGDALTPRSPDLTPASSVPGTPSHGPSDLPGLSSLRVSGRVSRISSAGTDRSSLGPPLVQSATDTIVDRCVRVREQACGMYLEPSHCSPMTPRFIPDLIDIQQELFELPQRVRCFPFLRASPTNCSLFTGACHVQQGDSDGRYRTCRWLYFR